MQTQNYITMIQNVHEIVRTQKRCLNHTELGFYERPLLYRQTNDDELQKKYRTKAYEKYYRYHNVRYIKMFNLVSHVYNIRYISNNIKLSKLYCSQLRGFDDNIKNHVLSYVSIDIDTFPYDNFVNIISNDDRLMRLLFNHKNDRVMLALMLLNTNYNKNSIEENNNFISNMRLLNQDIRFFSKVLETNEIYSLVCNHGIDYVNGDIDMIHMIDYLYF